MFQTALFCFNTQPPEGGWRYYGTAETVGNGFNTQPPEGGWGRRLQPFALSGRFNTQPPEGGWLQYPVFPPARGWVSTHSRLKAAGRWGGWYDCGKLGFNTQPPEGGWLYLFQMFQVLAGFNTQPPEGGWVGQRSTVAHNAPFQHTAA